MSSKSTETPRMSDDEEAHTSVEEIELPVTKQSYKEILMLAFSSLGAIYGDIGTSPLYVLNSIKYPHATPTEEDIFGGISIIFYLFIIIVLAKYAFVVLTYGPNEGEGGQIAIYAKIARHLHFGPKGVIIPGSPQRSDLELLKRVETTNSFMSSKSQGGWKKKPSVIKFISAFTLIVCFLGCALVISDGLLTPTTSVLSAVAGIQVAKPSFSHVLAVSEVILVFLFFIQQFGSATISYFFAPIIAVWLVGLIICGAINISHHPSVLKSLSPHYAIRLLKRSGVDAFGGSMLAITGTEAMFADLGHFGKVPTQIGISTVLFALIITYLGQGAYVIKHPESLPNVFYESIPGGTNSWFYWIMFVLAILSTIIASQALILGVFSILSQMINLDCFPKLRVVHVSSSYVGKVYIPMANLLLLIGVCATTAGFKNSNNVTAAYGLGISLDFLLTSLLLMVCFVYVYEYQWWVLAIYCLIFVPLEVCIIISNIKKVPHGGWFPLMMCAIFFSIFAFWRYCRSKTVEKQLTSRVRITDIFPLLKGKPASTVVDLGHKSYVDSTDISMNEADLSERETVEDEPNQDVKFDERLPFKLVSTNYGNVELSTKPGVAIIYSDNPYNDLSSPNSVPGVYERIVRSCALIPSVVIFCTIRVLSIPTVASEDRILVGATKIPGHYNCILRFGFMEQRVSDETLSQEILRQFPEVDRLRSSMLAKIPVLHIFEADKIRSSEGDEEILFTRNPLTWTVKYLRRIMIDHVFSPVNAIFQHDDQYVVISNEDDERREKIFVGGIMRI